MLHPIVSPPSEFDHEKGDALYGKFSIESTPLKKDVFMSCFLCLCFIDYLC